MTEEQKQRITGLYIVNWGVPANIHAANDGDLAIMEFGPTGCRRSSLLATNGMSRFVQGSADDDYRSELFLHCLKVARWMVEMLGLAEYPILNKTRLVPFDTIDVGRPLDGAISGYSGILIAPPTNEDSQAGAIIGAYFSPILINQVVGITNDEMLLAKSRGGEDVWNRLRARGADLCVDRSRESVVELDE